MTPATERARTVGDEPVACGITDAVLCPGSRNAPLAFALHAADAAGRLRLHVRIDERTAGFLALGLAVASGRPVPVATTRLRRSPSAFRNACVAACLAGGVCPSAPARWQCPRRPPVQRPPRAASSA